MSRSAAHTAVAWALRAVALAGLLAGGWFALRAQPGAQRAQWAGEGRRPRVLVTIYPLYLFAARIAGPDAEVRCLLPPGTDPHEFAMAPAHVRLAHNADVVIQNGAGIDDFVSEALGHGGARARTWTVADDLDLVAVEDDPSGEHHHDDGHDHGSVDPHAWLDPVMARTYARTVAAALADALERRADAPGARRVWERAALMDAELAGLHRDYVSRLAPHRGKPVLAFHGAMQYVTGRYGLHLAAVWQETPGKEPAPRDVARLLALARAEGIGALVAEPQFSRRALDVIATDAGLPVVTFDTLEAAVADSPESYVDKMRGNLAALGAVLEATRAPEP